jgi:YesN/AraC family two-component response regulator
MVVKAELEKLGLFCTSVEVGRVETLGLVSVDQMQHLKIALYNAGLELMDGKKNILVEKIKTVILDMVNYSDHPLKTNFSVYLSATLKLDYTYLANIFSEVQGITIEHFIIMNKIRRVKELLCCDDLTLTEISWKMHYSSVAHLSTQFKKVTGITPTHFKHMDCNRSAA